MFIKTKYQYTWKAIRSIYKYPKHIVMHLTNFYYDTNPMLTFYCNTVKHIFGAIGGINRPQNTVLNSKNVYIHCQYDF